MSPTSLPIRREAGLRGSHMLAVFLGFFGVIFAFNGYLVYSAISTYSGVVSKEPYRAGLAYNERIAAETRQEQLGWTDDLAAGKSGLIELSLRDRANAPVVGRIVTATVGRPSTSTFDRQLLLTERAPGDYATQSQPLEPGSWIVDVEVRSTASGEPEFRSRRRLWLKQ
jgi:nitrogen fixation protein FixH